MGLLLVCFFSTGSGTVIAATSALRGNTGLCVLNDCNDGLMM